MDCICPNEYGKKKLTFINNKTSKKNAEIYQKIISEVRKRCEERGKLYEYILQQTRPKFKALVSICKELLCCAKLRQDRTFR